MSIFPNNLNNLSDDNLFNPNYDLENEFLVPDKHTHLDLKTKLNTYSHIGEKPSVGEICDNDFNHSLNCNSFNKFSYKNIGLNYTYFYPNQNQNYNFHTEVNIILCDLCDLHSNPNSCFIIFHYFENDHTMVGLIFDKLSYVYNIYFNGNITSFNISLCLIFYSLEYKYVFAKKCTNTMNFFNDKHINESSDVVFKIGIPINHSHHLYAAKRNAKQPFATDFYTCIKPYPNSNTLILLMLLMCGDTGALLNPGPTFITPGSEQLPFPISNNENLTNIYTQGEVIINNDNTVHARNHINDNVITDNINHINENASIQGQGPSFPSQMPDNTFDCFKRRGLHFIHINARSMLHKLTEIKLLALKIKPAVITISESWLDESQTDESIKIDGFNVLRRDRISKSKGGGVCAYISNDIAYNHRVDLQNTQLEDLWLELLLPSTKPIFVGVCYRAPKNNSLINCLDSTMSKLRVDCDAIILGDFNICMLTNNSNLKKQYTFY